MKQLAPPLLVIALGAAAWTQFGAPPALAATDPNAPIVVHDIPEAAQPVLPLPPVEVPPAPPVLTGGWRAEIPTPAACRAPQVSYDPYIQAAYATGVPWQLLAAVHWREANMVPNRSAVSGEKLGAINPDTGKVEGSKLEATVLRSAQILKANAERYAGITDVVDENNWPDALLTYNRGGMYANAAERGHTLTWRDSAYVNALDRWAPVGHYGRGTDWGEPQSVQGKRDSRFGALEMVLCVEQHHNFNN